MTTNLSKEIGGYFGLDIDTDKYTNLQHHSVALNTARNCLRYLIKAYNITKMFRIILVLLYLKQSKKKNVK